MSKEQVVRRLPSFRGAQRHAEQALNAKTGELQPRGTPESPLESPTQTGHARMLRRRHLSRISAAEGRLPV